MITGFSELARIKSEHFPLDFLAIVCMVHTLIALRGLSLMLPHVNTNIPKCVKIPALKHSRTQEQLSNWKWSSWKV